MAEDKATKIEVAHNGPYLVHNVNNLVNSKGKKLEAKPMMALCRCGNSNNKPFCDGSHKTANFIDDQN